MGDQGFTETSPNLEFYLSDVSRRIELTDLISLKIDAIFETLFPAEQNYSTLKITRFLSQAGFSGASNFR